MSQGTQGSPIFSGGAQAVGQRQSLAPTPWPVSEVNERLLILGALTESRQLYGNPALKNSHGPSPVITQGRAFREGQHLAPKPDEGILPLVLVFPVLLSNGSLILKLETTNIKQIHSTLSH